LVRFSELLLKIPDGLGAILSKQKKALGSNFLPSWAEKCSAGQKKALASTILLSTRSLALDIFLPPPIEASSARLCPVLYRLTPSFPPCLPPPPPWLPVHQCNMEGGVDQAIIDRWQLRRLVRRDGHPRRGRSLAEEDNDGYCWRMDDPPDDVMAAVMLLDEHREKTSELSTLCEDDHTQHECAAGA